MQPQVQPMNMKNAGGVKSKADLMAEKIEEVLGSPWLGVRPDLLLHKGARNMEGGQTYVLEDPVSGSYFELGEAEARFFLCLVTEDSLKGAINKLLDTTSFRPSLAEIVSFLKMMKFERLTPISEEELFSEEAEKRREQLATMMKKKGGASSIYYFRVPLLRPDQFLEAIHPWVSPLWSRPFLFMYAVLSVIGVLFVCQQIELYFHTINNLFTIKGVVSFVCCVSVVKTLHELGHAMAAKHQGIYVRRVGLIFIVFIPMFFTDLTDAWKLATRRQRLITGAAGVMVELVIAGLALFAWSISSDGMFRSLMFYISSVSLFSTFLVNLNPLMRFDGYYVLMDYLRISSLRTRSAAMFKYYRRKILVAWQGAKPEEHPWERGMAVFGFFSGIYIFVIGISIQLMMYQILQSTMILIWGIIMLCVIFVGKPVVMDVVDMFKNIKYWGPWHALLLRAVVAAGLTSLLFIPLPSGKTLPGLYLYQDIARLESPGSGKIVSSLPKIGDSVQKGDVLLKIQDRMLEQEKESLSYEFEKIEASLKNMTSGGAQGAYRNWLLAERERLAASLGKIEKSLEQLVITSPVSGRVLDLGPTLKQDGYVYKRSYLITVGSADNYEVRAYVTERVYNELKEKDIVSAKISFWDLETPTKEIYFKTMQEFPVKKFPNQALFDFAGGPIVSSIISSASMAAPSFDLRSKGQQDQEGKMPDSVTAKNAHYPIVFTASHVADYLRHGTPCFIKIKGRATSLMDKLKYFYGQLMARLVLVK